MIGRRGVRWAEGFLAAVRDFSADWQLPASGERGRGVQTMPARCSASPR